MYLAVILLTLTLTCWRGGRRPWAWMLIPVARWPLVVSGFLFYAGPFRHLACFEVDWVCSDRLVFLFSAGDRSAWRLRFVSLFVAWGHHVVPRHRGLSSIGYHEASCFCGRSATGTWRHQAIGPGLLWVCDSWGLIIPLTSWSLILKVYLFSTGLCVLGHQLRCAAAMTCKI